MMLKKTAPDLPKFQQFYFFAVLTSQFTFDCNMPLIARLGYALD